MITYKKLSEIPEVYKSKLERLSFSSAAFSLEKYSNVIVKELDNSYTVYLDANSEWIKKELDKIEDKILHISVRPIYIANAFIEYGKVIKNRYGKDEQLVESSVNDCIDKPVFRTADSKMFKFQAKCLDNFEENGCELIKDVMYNVTHINIGGSYTSIGIYEFDKSFNSVYFQIYKDGKPYDIFKDDELNPYI